MSIPKNITREDILTAVDQITIENIPKNRLSKEYYLKCKEKILTPKYVISIANKFANSIELESNLFNAVEAKDFLERMDFIIESSPTEQKIKNDITKMKAEFEKYLISLKIKGSNKVSSYIRAIELLDIILIEETLEKLKGNNKMI